MKTPNINVNSISEELLYQVLFIHQLLNFSLLKSGNKYIQFMHPSWINIGFITVSLVLSLILAHAENIAS